MSSRGARVALSLLLAATLFELFGTGESALACKFTPLEWQQRVDRHATEALVGQRKHTTWSRDRNRNFIDDEIERRYRPGELVNVVIDLNTCLTPSQVHSLLSKFGKVTHISPLVSVVMLNAVRFDELPALAALPQVAMIELQQIGRIMLDTSTRAVQARPSQTFSPNTAGDVFPPVNGSGVHVAILDTGVHDAHQAFTGKFVAGFDAVTNREENPADVQGHGTHVAGIALGNSLPGSSCRSAADDTSLTTPCAGVASGAGLVDVRVCDANGFCTQTDVTRGLDWLGLNAQRWNVRVANMSLGYCDDDDGTGAMAQQINYVIALGVTVVVGHGNADPCGLAAGATRTMLPGSASLAVTVAATDDRQTVRRGDETNMSMFLRGPRTDFNLVTPDLRALKPDLSAPGEGIKSAQSDTLSSYVRKTGTSMASPHVAGAAAIILQARPDIDAGSLKDLLTRTADTTLNVPAFPTVDPTWDTALGGGMLNVWQALAAAGATDVGFPNCVGAPARPGHPCAVTSPYPPWNNALDIATLAEPQAGVPNALVAQVRNGGAVPATVLVNFGVYVLAVGNNQFFHIGTQRVTVPAMTTISVSQPWTPAASDHQCIQVSIDFGLDTNFGNNVTQRNLAVAPSEFQVRIENPFLEPAVFSIQVKADTDGWRCFVSETSFSLDPVLDCPRTVRVTLDPPPGAKPGDRANCDVGVFGTPKRTAKQGLIGGVTVQSFVPIPCRVVGVVLDSAGGAVEGAGLAFVRQTEETATAKPEEVRFTTDKDGVFSGEVTPYVPYVVLVEKAGVGKGSLAVRPRCGFGTLQFVLGESGLTLRSRTGDVADN